MLSEDPTYYTLQHTFVIVIRIRGDLGSRSSSPRLRMVDHGNQPLQPEPPTTMTYLNPFCLKGFKKIYLGTSSLHEHFLGGYVLERPQNDFLRISTLYEHFLGGYIFKRPKNEFLGILILYDHFMKEIYQKGFKMTY